MHKAQVLSTNIWLLNVAEMHGHGISMSWYRLLTCIWHSATDTRSPSISIAFVIRTLLDTKVSLVMALWSQVTSAVHKASPLTSPYPEPSMLAQHLVQAVRGGMQVSPSDSLQLHGLSPDVLVIFPSHCQG